jgi:hypothetical protein
MIVAVTAPCSPGLQHGPPAYFNDFLRGYYIAFITSLAVFALIWFGQPFYLIAAGLLIMIPGVILFVHFIREHPLPPAEARHE